MRGHHITSFTVNELYMFMGRELELLEMVPAGSVLGQCLPYFYCATVTYQIIVVLIFRLTLANINNGMQILDSIQQGHVNMHLLTVWAFSCTLVMNHAFILPYLIFDIDSSHCYYKGVIRSLHSF